MNDESEGTFLREAKALIVLCTVLLLISSAGKLPIGYLHSWNQITTLSHISILSLDLSLWNAPLDVVTRVSAHPTPKKLSPDSPYSDFRIYEEFPLYHLLSALLAKIGGGLEDSSSLISALSYALAGLGLFKLCSTFLSSRSAFYALFLWLVSFPVLYYGQAIMSDMSMTAAAIWSIYYFVKYENTKLQKHALAGLLLATLSSLFKSFGIIALLPWFLHFLSRKKYFLAILIAVIFSAPIIGWHTWTISQSGHQEISSHSLNAKISILLSTEYILSLQKYFFRYLSYAPGIVVILFSCMTLLKREKSLNTNPILRFLLPSWIFASAVYLIFSADKIPDHDYYFLLISPGFFILGGHAIHLISEKLQTRFSRNFLSPFLPWIILLSVLPFSLSNLNKALKHNQDVTTCGEVVHAHSPKSAIIGNLSDISRHNSIIYYANRFGLTIEQDLLPLSHYLPYGLSYLVLNFSEEEYNAKEKWLYENNGVNLELVMKVEGLQDFKSRRRTCALFEVKSKL